MNFTTSSIAQLQQVSHLTLTSSEKIIAWNKNVEELSLVEARYVASLAHANANVNPLIADDSWQD